MALRNNFTATGSMSFEKSKAGGAPPSAKTAED